MMLTDDASGHWKHAVAIGIQWIEEYSDLADVLWRLEQQMPSNGFAVGENWESLHKQDKYLQ